MSAAELRQAAETLRKRATAEGAWPCAEYISSGIRHLQRNCDLECSHGEWSEADQKYIDTGCPSPEGSWDRYSTATYIATMHPGVGLALAEWLDHQSYAPFDSTPSLTLARLINVGAS